MEKRMTTGNFDEITCSIVAFTGWVMSHVWSFPMLQVPQYPVASELVISSIRLIFGVATAVIAYLSIHWCKTYITHEVKPKKKNNSSH